MSFHCTDMNLNFQEEYESKFRGEKLEFNRAGSRPTYNNTVDH